MPSTDAQSVRMSSPAKALTLALIIQKSAIAGVQNKPDPVEASCRCPVMQGFDAAEGRERTAACNGGF